MEMELKYAYDINANIGSSMAKYETNYITLDIEIPNNVSREEAYFIKKKAIEKATGLKGIRIL